MSVVAQLSPYGFFVAGLAASGHCALMCGPLVALASKQSHSANDQLARLVRLQLGKITGYSLLGGFAGFLGRELTTALSADSVTLIRCLALLLMLLLLSRWLTSKTRHQHCSARALPQPSASLFWRGIGLALIPCPLLFTVLIYSSLMASPGLAAISMFSFGLASAVLPTFAALGLHRWQANYLPYSRLLAVGSMLGLALVMSVVLAYWGPNFKCF